MNADDLNIRNRFFDLFSNENNFFLTPTRPSSVSQPQIISWSQDLALQLKLDSTDPRWTFLLSGNQILPSMKPYAARYGGYQFGHWAGQLGDGRAITLGEFFTEQGFLEIQLKGAGLTPYSRNGDGRAVLRSSLREFMCSEAMQALGVPSTRALSLVLTGDQVVRDILYDGNPEPEKGAIVTRVSPSFIRFGNLEILAAEKKYTELKKICDYVIENFYSDILHIKNEPERYAEFLKQISLRTADLMAWWMSLGFVHGVMNTDNMSILGLTIDYGPYGWVEEFDPDFTPNTTDFSQKRYRYSHQPEIAMWNLNSLANALYPLIQDKDLVVTSLMSFQTRYESSYIQKLEKKLGVSISQNNGETMWISELFELLALYKIDYSLFFRTLSDTYFDQNFLEKIKYISYAQGFSMETDRRWMSWLNQYQQQIAKKTDPDRILKMKKNNPSLIFRNYLAQQAIDQANQGDYSLIENYLRELREPYKDRDLRSDPLTFKRPAWADQKPGCSILSCSS